MAGRTFARRLPLALLSALAVATFWTVALAEMPSTTNALDGDNVDLSITPVMEKNSVADDLLLPLERKRRRLEENNSENPDTPPENDEDDEESKGDNDNDKKKNRNKVKQHNKKKEEENENGNGAGDIDSDGSDTAESTENGDGEAKGNRNKNQGKQKKKGDRPQKGGNQGDSGGGGVDDTNGNSDVAEGSEVSEGDKPTGDDDFDTNESLNQNSSTAEPTTQIPTSGVTSIKEEIPDDDNVPIDDDGAKNDDPGIGHEDPAETTGGNAVDPPETLEDADNVEATGGDASPEVGAKPEGTEEINADENKGNQDAQDGADTETNNDENGVTAAPVESPPDESEPEAQSEEYYFDDENQYGGILFLAFIGSIVLCVMCIKRKDKVASIFQAVTASNGGGPGSENVSKTTKYEPVCVSI